MFPYILSAKLLITCSYRQLKSAQVFFILFCRIYCWELVYIILLGLSHRFSDFDKVPWKYFEISKYHSSSKSKFKIFQFTYLRKCIFNSDGHFSFSLTYLNHVHVNQCSKSRMSEVINYFKVREVKWLPCWLLQHVMLLCFPAYWWLFICHRSLSLTIVFPFFANYNDTLHCMPCWKINKPKGTTESWPCSCSRIIANRLL